ncbi:MAG: lipoyl synthase [Elusimicrobia bacterium RBG_16_66_12]|nr:MAG: lipoyl synthase [Elusimicrobia bacterium RBG_16_66_12]
MAPTAAPSALPPWLKVRLPAGPVVARLKEASRSRGLATVCEEARCPNMGECWGGGTATFMVMGDTCTRGCRFCSVATAARPPLPDPEEPSKLALTLKEMAVDYAVLTTVCRDDLADQGAAHLAACIREVKQFNPGLKVEMLLQDFRGETDLLEQVLDAGPDVVAHNVECVESLTSSVRDAKASYHQSLRILAHAKSYLPKTPTKTSLMLGLGETADEIFRAFEDIRSTGVEILTLGQYLRPTGSKHHLPVARFLPPEEFDRLAEMARSHGFPYVASAPFVRSSYRAAELFPKGHL